MAPVEASGGSRKRKRTAAYEDGTYILRSLVKDVPLSADGEASDIRITCVEHWDGNLYIGTSAAEILHFVSLPPDPTELTTKPSFILASRLQPTYTQPSSSSQALNGIQQILLLPLANKACILCNGTLTFYSLPELSPAFGTTKLPSCCWVGGVDLNAGNADSGGEIVMVSTKNRIKLVKVGDGPRLIKNIEHPGCLSSMRRNAFACVADAHSYALLDVEQQRKIPLFPISSLDEGTAGVSGGQVEAISRIGPNISRSASSGRAVSYEGSSDDRSHGRSTSLGTFVSGLGRRQPSPRPRSSERSNLETPEPFARAGSPLQASSPERTNQRESSPETRAIPPHKPLPPAPQDDTAQQALDQIPKPATVSLKPHILSPTPTEFLLTTGTAPSEPGVGIFVNLDGDVVRGTLEFSRYPEALVVDGQAFGAEAPVGGTEDVQKGYVLAIVGSDGLAGPRKRIEIQRWDVDAGAGGSGREWLDLPHQTPREDGDDEQLGRPSFDVGIRTTATAGDIPLPEIGDKLRLVHLRLPSSRPIRELRSLEETSDSRTKGSLERVSKEMELFEAEESGEEPLPRDWQTARDREEASFARRLSGIRSHTVLWCGDSIWWVVKNPLISKLDAALSLAESSVPLDRRKVVEVIHSVRSKEAGTELEFLSLSYIRQKASLLLFADALTALESKAVISEPEKRATEDILIEGSVDPRVVLTMLSPLREEVLEGRQGIWIHGGLIQVAERPLAVQLTFNELEADNVNRNGNFLSLLKRYLMAWRRKKGFGSIADEKVVFQSVDAALIHVLLQLDSHSPRGPGRPASVRAELNSVVDHGLESFDRAVELLERYRRLYILSRLYQSRKMASKVLSTWRRILDGEPDDGGEFVDGENEVRKYLVKIRDASLVEEFGTWLAKRNPKLGVRVFADDGSRVKFEPAQVVRLLRRESPDAIKEYLEHLVFGKNNVQYANDLIAYYLDTVLSVLETSDTARSTLAQSYESYRALRPPKPTYHQFITDNAIGEEWWHNRLRLLQLLGGSHGVGFTYDAPAILGRLEPFQQELVPEMIILDGRQARHERALHLLTHGLGDYDTAINYCLLGGSSIFHPTSGPIPAEAIPSHEEQAQLFDYLLFEFLGIEDISDRVERTGELLDRFGAWYDVDHVLSLIPDSWSVELVSGFLVSAFRRLVREKSEAMIAKALSGAENLKVSADFIGKCERVGPKVEAVE
ncbi:MAG: hypothetical protein M1830_006735 [Pleopsidium flavum]|nr:MAG: hypothetical protein M1830_006735 [Pleopsidium flavum]